MAGWKEQLFELVISNADIEILLNAAAQHLQVSILLVDSGFNPIYSSKMPDAMPIWHRLFEDNSGCGSHMPQVVAWVQSGALEQLRNCRQGVALRTLEQTPVFLFPIKSGEEYSGYLAFFTNSTDDNFSYDDAAAAAAAVQVIVRQTPSIKFSSRSHLLDLLLNSPNLAQHQLQKLLRQEHITPALWYNLLCLRHSVVSAKANRYAVLFNHLHLTFPDSLMLVNDDAIVVLTANVSKFVAYIEQAYSSDGLRIGISNRFQDLLQCSLYLRQAYTALIEAENHEQLVVRYHQIMTTDILAHLEQTLPLDTLCMPHLLEMDHYDRENQTDYINTLRAIALCNGRRSDAAEFLQIHLNTLKYRINQIKLLFGLDISRRGALINIYSSLVILDRLRERERENER